MANENQAEQPEPLNNVELESAALGLRMTLDDDEARLARALFLEKLRVSPVAVPTLTPVQTGPDGAVIANAEINLLVVSTPEGVSGVPTFTTLAGLRTALPEMENGMFLTGGDLGNILGQSEHRLFVDSPDAHIEVESAELQQMAFVTHQIVAAQQAAAQGNEALTQALETLKTSDTPANREGVVKAFMEGFCMYVVAAESDSDEDAVVLSQQEPQDGATTDEIAILTLHNALPCFTSMEILQKWDTVGRSAIPIPGQMIVPLATQAEVAQITLNPGSEAQRTLRVSQEQITVE